MAPSKKMKMSTEPEETLTLPEKKRETLEEGEDRISNLPDSLLVHILSLLDSTQEAIKTGTLSKRWESVWTTIPKLVFDHYNVIYHSNSEFVSLVNKTIDHCRSCKDKLRTFKVNFMHHPVFVSDVKSWISFAVSRNVEELELLMWDAYEFKLPQRIFINSSFTRLVLDGCILKPKREICWKNLRDLHIFGAFLDENLIENILSGSPLLETLGFIECKGYSQLNITSKSLKVLSVIGYSHLFTGKDAIEINAPNILSLEIGGDLSGHMPLLQNVSALVDAKLDCRIQEAKEVEEELLKGLIQNLGHVKDLTIGVSCSKVVSRLRAKGFPFPSNMKFPVLMSQSDSDTDSLEDVDLTSSDSDTLEDGDFTSSDSDSLDYGDLSTSDSD